ncbi:MAG TPA: hypothetical protein VK324_15335 [Tepidisphaeraceae bacterium]|nr:hypothetical protein [Tepidisphaeraceae bacterium]
MDGTARMWSRALERTEAVARLTHGCVPPDAMRASLTARPVELRSKVVRPGMRHTLPAAARALVRRALLAA